ncbi:hypothetical protein ACRRTK_018094 [Alexandromys fortis]
MKTLAEANRSSDSKCRVFPTLLRSQQKTFISRAFIRHFCQSVGLYTVKGDGTEVHVAPDIQCDVFVLQVGLDQGEASSRQVGDSSGGLCKADLRREDFADSVSQLVTQKFRELTVGLTSVYARHKTLAGIVMTKGRAHCIESEHRAERWSQCVQKKSDVEVDCPRDVGCQSIFFSRQRISEGPFQCTLYIFIPPVDGCEERMEGAPKFHAPYDPADPSRTDGFRHFYETVPQFIWQTTLSTDKGLDTKQAQVIVLSSGTKCISGEHISDQGLVVNDCHAEIVARRAFLHFLYTQLELHLSKHREDSERSIFVRLKEGGYRLRENILFHLYRAELLDNGIRVIRSLLLGASSRANKGPKTIVTIGQRQARREPLGKSL